MSSKERFAWLELKPQQKFKDDDSKKILDVITRASEFGFFVIRESDKMRIMVRTGKHDLRLFQTISGMSVEKVSAPSFERMFSKYLALKCRSFEPLVDLKAITPGNIYSALWAGRKNSMMACLVRNVSEKFSSKIRRTTRLYDTRSKRKNVVISSRETEENDFAKQRRGHAHYNCCIIFGVQLDRELSAMKSQMAGRINDEKEDFESKVNDLKDLDGEALKKEREILTEAHQENMEKIEDYFYPEIEAARDEIGDARQTLEAIMGNILINKFEEKVIAKRARLVAGQKSLRQKMAELFGGIAAIDPATFVPKKSYSKCLVLAENELAHFVSFPTEYEIQTINFEMGPNPTFVHGKTEEIDKTDLEIQGNNEESPEDKDEQN